MTDPRIAYLAQCFRQVRCGLPFDPERDRSPVTPDDIAHAEHVVRAFDAAARSVHFTGEVPR